MLLLKYISANSLRRLQEVFMELQVRQGKSFNYHPPIKEGNQWIITWYEPMEKESLTTEILDGRQPTRQRME